jgi:hypothetical protein
MWRVQFRVERVGNWSSVQHRFATEEEALVAMVVQKFRWPDDEWRILDPQGNVVT